MHVGTPLLTRNPCGSRPATVRRQLASSPAGKWPEYSGGVWAAQRNVAANEGKLHVHEGVGTEDDNLHTAGKQRGFCATFACEDGRLGRSGARPCCTAAAIKFLCRHCRRLARYRICGWEQSRWRWQLWCRFRCSRTRAMRNRQGLREEFQHPLTRAFVQPRRCAPKPGYSSCEREEAE